MQATKITIKSMPLMNYVHQFAKAKGLPYETIIQQLKARKLYLEYAEKNN